MLTQKNKPWKIVLELVLIVLLLFMAGCAQTTTEEGTDMSQERSNIKMQKPPIDHNIPEKLETATFALGWFWGPDAQYGQLKGVVRTRVGYAGGKMENPTYRQMGDHTETFQVDYDPSLISYEELLDLYWNSHNPFRQSMSRQYMNIIFTHNEEQEKLAHESKVLLEQKQNGRVITKIVSFSNFYQAEGYHQKYYLQNSSALMDEFMAFYPAFQDFVDSTAAARVNGYVSGFGDAASLSRELEDLGLSDRGVEILKRKVK